MCTFVDVFDYCAEVFKVNRRATSASKVKNNSKQLLDPFYARYL